MVRQMQEKLAKMKPMGSVAAAQQQARKTGLAPVAGAASDSPRRRGQQTQWKPAQTPRIRPDELVMARWAPQCKASPVVPRTLVPPCGWYGIGDVTLTIGDRQIPFHGHLKLAGEASKVVITVADTETSESLRHKLEWIDGKILYVRKLGTSNVAVVTFKGRRLPRFIHCCSENVSVRYYKKTVPACYRCGTLGHRADACPDDQRCIHCGAMVTPDDPMEHNCQPKCLICSGNHFAGSAERMGKFRKAWKSTRPQLKNGPPLHHKQGGPTYPATGVKKPQDSKQSKTGQPKPSNVQAGPTSKPPTFQAGDFLPLVSPQQKVISWAGAASQPPATTSLSPSKIEISKQLEIMQKRIATPVRENQALKATQAPPRTEPESMQTSAGLCIYVGHEELESGSDLSGYTSVSKTETVVANLEDIETRLSRLATKFEEQNNMIMEQIKLKVEHIILQQVNLAVKDAIKDLKQSLVPIFTASILQTVQNWLTPQLEEIKASIKMPAQRRRKIVHRKPANSESKGALEQPAAHQIETSMPTQAPKQAPVVRSSLTKRWRKNKFNRKLKLRIAELSMQAAECAAQLNDSNWTERCNAVARQMNSKGAWRLFRSLIDPTQTRGEAQEQLRQALHGFHGTNSELADAPCDKYLCRTLDPDKTACEYAARENRQLDAPFAIHDLKAALAKMHKRQAGSCRAAGSLRYEVHAGARRHAKKGGGFQCLYGRLTPSESALICAARCRKQILECPHWPVRLVKLMPLLGRTRGSSPWTAVDTHHSCSLGTIFVRKQPNARAIRLATESDLDKIV
ncbi:hypothetical protein HPB49_007973 [Dermacentor silvarum]|uniref:Uncharacterized protein n=1 Tax=Dermacentor silvarum TaxID=543639 RepID=A0ACB8DXR2_DERSI|nr:hypothetical protein HPB49_007973 [Dermacentor silvarum]